MAIAQADLDAINDLTGQLQSLLDVLFAGISAGEQLDYTPNRKQQAGPNPAVVDEAVGTASSDGDTQGDFKLDYPPDDIADVASITVGGVARTPVSGGALGATDVLVVLDSDATRADGTAGELQFGQAETGAIVANYTPRNEDTEAQARSWQVEDETIDFVTSPGNNERGRAGLLGLHNPGRLSSPDAA